MARALGVHEVLNKKYTCLEGIPDEWQRVIGIPQDNFSMIIYGNSGNGKSEFVVQLCKMLTQYGKVAYNSLEQGDSKTMQDAWIRNGMEDVKGKILLIDREHYDELYARLEKKKSPKIVVIDSVQYMNIDYEQYKKLKERFRKKIFIWISHAEGKNPDAKAAKKIMYDVDIKVWVEQYVAYPRSRYGGSEPYIIWKERAVLDEAWVKRNKKKKQSKQTSMQLEVVKNEYTNKSCDAKKSEELLSEQQHHHETSTKAFQMVS
jgi:hypothetical protein